MNVHESIIAAQKQLSETGIAKARKNAGQGFNFRGIDDALQALSPVLTSCGLYISPSVRNRTVAERKTQKGGELYFVTVDVEFTVTAADGTSIKAQTIGEAMDSADKATNKAMSAAYKYMAFMLFCIPIEGIPDADSSEDLPPLPKIALDARSEAMKGTAAYQAFWMSLTPYERSTIGTDEHAQNKEVAKRVDG